MDNQVEVVEKNGKVSLRTRAGTALAVGTTYALTAVPAHAESSLSSVGAAFTGELEGAKAVIITILSAAAIVLGLLVGWRYMKRGGSAA